MKKRILSILLALAVLVSLVPLTAYAGTGTVKEVATQQELVDTLADASTDTVKLTSNIIIDAVLTVERKVTLDLNGCVLGYTNASAPFEAMNITGDLTLVDSNPNAEHRFTCPYGAYGDTLLVYDEDNGERVVKGGIITNYGMHISGGKLTLNGGSIVGSNCGVGAVEARNGSEFTMNDGAILGCYGGDIGGVYVADSTFTMNGGVIKENFAASISEGALFAYPNAVVNANGGEMHGLTVIDDNSMITKSKDAKGVTSFFGELRVFYKSAVRSGIFYGGITVGSESLGLSGITVTYKNGTDDYAKQVLQSGETAVRPVDPEKSDRAFKGWYTDEACKNEYDFTKGVTENITLYAGWTLPEQFSLEVGETYYFDLSSMKIPGTKNWLLPDSTLHYVPFTYAGTISAYQLSQAQIPTESNVFETVHSVFVSDYNVTYGVSWDELNKEKLIFWGNIIKQQGVEYYIHAPTGGANGRGPFNNEWQRIYDKNPGYLKNTGQRVSVAAGPLKMKSWCQDTAKPFTDENILRAEGNIVSARPSSTSDDNGYRPLLTFALAYNVSYPENYAGTVTLKLNGGKLGTSGDDLKIAVKNIEVLYPTGEEVTFNAPAAAGLSRPDGNTESYFMWLGDDGNLYAPGAKVPASVKTLTAKWSDHTHCACGGKNEEDTHSHSSIDWQPWSATDSLPTSSGNYYLVNNVVLSAQQKLNANINLCFNGKTVSVKQYALSAGERMISVDSKTPVTVTLTDCSSGGLLDATDAVSFGITYLANAVSVCEDNKLVICGGVTVNGDVHLNDNAEARITDRASLKGDKAAFTTSDNTKLFIEGNSRVEHAQATDKTKVRISGEARVEGGLSLNNESELVACDNVTINEILWQNLAGSPSISLEGKARVSGEFRIMAYEDDKTVHLTMNDIAQIRGDLLLVGKGKNIKVILSGDRIDILGTMEFVNISSSCENITVEAEDTVRVGTDINMPGVVLNGHFVCGGEIKDGIFDENGIVTNNGKITGGIFYGTVFGTANIEDSAKRTASFDTNGGSAVDPQKILRGQKAKAPTESKKDGYVFDGWYKGTEKYNFNTPVLDDFTLTAQWTESAFTVRFDTAGGTDIADKTGVKWNDKVLDGVVSPTKEGHSFIGWKFQDTDVSFGTAYKDLANDDSVQSITLEAQWLVNKYTVTFDTDGGSFLAPITEDYGTELLAPKAPTKTGYTFDGWDKAFPNTMPAENITLKATWKINTYTVTFDSDGGTPVPSQKVKYGECAEKPDPAPEKFAYYVGAWVDENRKIYDFSTPVTRDITLKAAWLPNVYSIEFDANGGEGKASIMWAAYDHPINLFKNPFTKEGYAFKCWNTEPDGSGTSYKDEEEILNLTSENFAKIKLYAQWKDVTPPDGKITIGSYEWDSFTDTVNPGRFFKENVTVTITASDNSGTAEIGYILSPQDLSVEELKKTVFKVYEENFEISGDGEYIVYVLLYDMNLNLSYIRSERITVDSVAPVISGAENGGVYCGGVTLKVTENNLDSLKIDGVLVTPEADGTFKVLPKDGEQTVEAVDKSGNITQLKLTVFSEHDFEWKRVAFDYWQVCKHCGYETPSKRVPDVKITVPKQICRGQDAEYTCEVEEGFKDPEAYFYFAFSEDNVSGTPEVIKDGNVYRCKVKSSLYPTDDNWLCVGVYLTNEEDGFRFLRTKVIEVLDEHTGGKATCTKQAVCDICGESYGDVDPDCHAPLVKVSAKESTHFEEGCIEHWKCPDCGKLFADSEGIAEMAPEDVVIKKTPEHKVPESAKPEYDEKSHWYVCECGEKTGEEDHSFKWVIDKEPTADSTGLKHEECTVCKYKRSENTVIPKNSVPYTGDLIMLWAALFVISGGYLSIAAVGRKRKKAVR